MKFVKVIKTALTWWLFDRAACKGCRERNEIIIETLNKIIFRTPKPELIGYRNELIIGSVRRYVAKTLHTLVDMSNDVNNIHF